MKSRSLAAILGVLFERGRRNVAQGLAVSIVIQAGGGLVAFAMFSLAARVLSSEDFGHLATWLSVSQMGSIIAIFGQEMFILRSLNQYTVADQPDLAKGALLFSTAIVCIGPVLLSISAGLGFLALGISLKLVTAMGLISRGELSTCALQPHRPVRCRNCHLGWNARSILALIRCCCVDLHHSRWRNSSDRHVLPYRLGGNQHRYFCPDLRYLEDDTNQHRSRSPQMASSRLVKDVSWVLDLDNPGDDQSVPGRSHHLLVAGSRRRRRLFYCVPSG